MMMSLMPIIIMLLVMVMAIVVAIRLSRLGQRTAIIRNWVMSVYGVALIAAFVISFFLPLQAGTDAVAERTFDKEKVPSLYMTSELDRFNDELQDYAADEWTLETDAEELDLIVLGEEQDHINVVVEYKNENDGMIEATLYVTPYVIEGIDMTTGLFPETTVNISDNRLLVETPMQRKRLDLSVMKQGFTVRQFTEEGWFADIKEEFSSGTSFGVGDETVASEDDPWMTVENGRIFSTQMLYIRVPAGTTLNPVDVYIDEWRNVKEGQG